MSLHERYARHGAKPEHEPYLADALRLAEDMGWNINQYDLLVAVGLDADRMGLQGDELTDHLHSALAGTMQTHDVDVLTTWGTGIRDNGGEIPKEQSVNDPERAEAQALRTDIEKYMKDNFAAYSRDEEMQQAYRATLETIEGKADVSPSAPATPPAPGSDRRREIERTMRDDLRSYFRDESMQTEYRQILEAQSPPQPEGTTSEQPVAS